MSDKTLSEIRSELKQIEVDFSRRLKEFESEYGVRIDEIGLSVESRKRIGDCDEIRRLEVVLTPECI